MNLINGEAATETVELYEKKKKNEKTADWFTHSRSRGRSSGDSLFREPSDD